MVKRAITNNGRCLCSICGAIVQRDTTMCYQCNSPLSGEFHAVICAACGSIVPSDTPTCTVCGVEVSQGADAASSKSLDADIVSAVEDLRSTVSVDDGVASSRSGTGEGGLDSSAVEHLRQMNTLFGDLEAAIEKREWERLPAIREGLAENLDKLGQMVLSSGGGDGVGLTVSHEELKKKEEYLNERMEELRALVEKREREGLMFKEKEEDIRSRETALAEREAALNERVRQIESQRSGLEERERLLTMREGRLSEREAALKEQEEMRGMTGGVRSRESIERVGKMSRQLLAYLRKKADGPQAARSISVLEKIVAELDGVLDEGAEAQPAGMVPQPDSEDAKELRRLLKVLDDLLGELSEDVIERFANSEDFTLYERILKRYGV